MPTCAFSPAKQVCRPAMTGCGYEGLGAGPAGLKNLELGLSRPATSRAGFE